MSKYQASAGFTLIEMILYISLCSLIFASALTSAFALITTNTKTESSAEQNQEMYFVLRKLDLISQAIVSVQIPISASVATSSLTMSATLESQPSVLQLDLHEGRLRVTTGSDSGYLNSSRFPIQNLLFNRTAALGSPSGVVTISFVCNNQTYSFFLFPLHE